MVKNPPANARDSGWIPGLAKFPGEGNGYPLQYSCLENLMDRGTWWATDHGVTRSLIDWFDLLTVQGTLKCLLQHHSSKASVLQCSAFFIVQLSHPHMTTGKTIALTRQTFVGQVTSLLFNMLSMFVITFLLRSKCLLISWLQSLSTVILEPPTNKVFHCFLCFPIYLP